MRNPYEFSLFFFLFSFFPKIGNGIACIDSMFLSCGKWIIAIVSLSPVFFRFHFLTYNCVKVSQNFAKLT